MSHKNQDDDQASTSILTFVTDATAPASLFATKSQDSYNTSRFEVPVIAETKQRPRKIRIGEIIPYGVPIYDELIQEEAPDYFEMGEMKRIKDICYHQRVILIGVLGAFTPDCWNRHLYLALNHLDYFKARGVHQICVIATNDIYTQTAWGKAIGISDKVTMLSDITNRFTKAIGMDVIVPWLGNHIRSRRYIMQIDNLTVKNLLTAPDLSPDVQWDCEHIAIVDTDSAEFL